MRELVEFLLIDIENIRVRIERQVGDPIYDEDELNELNSILIMMKLYILKMDTLDDPTSIMELQEILNVMIKEMERVIANDLDSPFRTLIWGMQHNIDLWGI
ncbi:hypothetical protein [Bacillus sp. 445_BSPC]|uniref:hypothetical protein n=1 Tax=Bacillus sp. 445_BSPC TaxID=1581712 RepID=UPI000662441B|nr:hypothetical protein [Bacillus sp. 445_BSPC]